MRDEKPHLTSPLGEEKMRKKGGGIKLSERISNSIS